MSSSSENFSQDLPMRYARALFELAQQDNSTTEVASSIGELIEVFNSNPTLFKVAKNPFAMREKLAKLLADVSGQIKSPILLSNLVGVLIKRRRLAILPAIAIAFENLLAEYQHKTIVDVVSAHPLSQDQYDRLFQVISDYVGGELKVRTSVDADLVGGLTVQIGSSKLDASIAARLKKFRDKAMQTAG